MTYCDDCNKQMNTNDKEDRKGAEGHIDKEGLYLIADVGSIPNGISITLLHEEFKETMYKLEEEGILVLKTVDSNGVEKKIKYNVNK